MENTINAVVLLSIGVLMIHLGQQLVAETKRGLLG